MRYMMLIYSHEDDAAQPADTSEERRAVAAAHSALMEEARNRGIFRGADPLEPSATATTIRVENARSVITDGPFAETKEQLGGYYLLEAPTIEAAAAIAAGIPAARYGSIEVRPIMIFG